MKFTFKNRTRAQRAALVLGTSVLCLPLAYAADPIGSIGSIISYQGLLSDNTGKPVADGDQSITFKIYEDGTEKSSQTVPVKTVKGVFNAFLPIGDVTFDPDKSYELGIIHNGNEVKHPIAAVPVASQAKSAKTALNVSGVVPIANGGTGSDIKNFVDLTNAQIIEGAKTFSNDLTGNGSLLLQGENGSTPASGAGVRLMWIPEKKAVRAGIVEGDQWDAANIGVGSAAFGKNNRASGENSFAMGEGNQATARNSVALGENGAASAERSLAFNGTASDVGSIALGSGAQATHDDAVALGSNAIADGDYSVAIGPSGAYGSFATAIGLQNRAGGDFSLALGKNASTCSDPYCGPGATRYKGTISISDASADFSTDALTASANNQFNARAVNGYRFFTSRDLSSGVQVAPGGGSWESLSDRNAKENFSPVNSREVLNKVLKLPISTWNYKTQKDSIRHIGPMAQDFKAAFNLGSDDKRISTIDPDGVAFAAIQGLNSEIKERDAEIIKLKAQNAAFEARLKRLESRLN